MPKVSIITPAFNAENYISETIESVQKQTFKDWEMIIVDDCSTDYTNVLAKEYAAKDPRIKVIKAPQNGGVAKARNIGLENATGEYIAFVDSDDLWKPEKLEKQLAFMEKNGYVLTYTDFRLYDETNGQTGKAIKTPLRMSANDILKDTSIPCLTVMVDKKQSGEFRMPLLGHTEDNCTWYNILKNGDHIAYRLPEVLSLYRIGHQSMTKNKSKAAKMQWQTYREFFHFSVTRSAYYFICYAFNAIKRRLLNK